MNDIEMDYELVPDQPNELFTALSAAQGEIKNPLASIKAYNYKYADLNLAMEAIRAPFAKNGLAVIQLVGKLEDNAITVSTLLTHKSGQYVSATTKMPVDVRKGAQGVGSAITYCRRYALLAIAGIAPADDDDGKQTSENAPKNDYRAPNSHANGMAHTTTPRKAKTPQNANKDNPRTNDELSARDKLLIEVGQMLDGEGIDPNKATMWGFGANLDNCTNEDLMKVKTMFKQFVSEYREAMKGQKAG